MKKMMSGVSERIFADGAIEASFFFSPIFLEH